MPFILHMDMAVRAIINKDIMVNGMVLGAVTAAQSIEQRESIDGDNVHN